MLITKRRAVAVGALALAAGLVAACGSSSNGAASGGSSDQTLTVAWAENPAPLNPATTSQQDVGPIDANIFNTLTWLTPGFKVTPDLAKSWTVSPDGKTYTFDLRTGVKFQDGTPFNAQAVVANINYITAPATKSTVAVGLLGPCVHATATSEYVVTITCSSPYAPLLNQLSEPYMGMESPTAITKYGANLDTHLVGTGPYALESFTSNQSVVLKRNPDYKWAPPALGSNGPAKFAKIVFNIVPSPQARLESLESGQSQLIQQVPGIDYLKLHAGYQQLSVPIPGLGDFATITTTKAPTNDLAVRQAILYSVNRASVIKLADSGAFPTSNTPLVKGMLGYSSSLASLYPYDPAKAAQILKGDGWTKSGQYWTKDGKPLSLSIAGFSDVPEYATLAEAIQTQLRANGMQASVTLEGRSAYLNAASNGEFNITPTSYDAVDPAALGEWFLSGSLFNWSKYNSPTLTNLLNQAQVATSLSQRASLYQQAQQIIMSQGLIIPERPDADLVLMSKKLTGVSYEGGGFETFYSASLG
jgi:peptide/nickel transport system substrate-binding protein